MKDDKIDWEKNRKNNLKKIWNEKKNESMENAKK